MIAMDHTRYLIVGGGLAGGSAIEAIRVRDGEGRIVLVSEERHLPYDRVPLSKDYLTGELRRENLFLQGSEFYQEQRVETLLGRRAQRLKLQARTAVLDDSRELQFERLLLATGGRPRRLRIPGNDLPGIYYLRTLDDSDAIQAAMSNSRRAVIVGGGFIGCEIAAACAKKGIGTTILEVGPSLLNAALDPETAQWMTQYLVNQGVHFVGNETAARFIDEKSQVAGVETTLGRRIPGNFVVVGIGIEPNVELAQEAGLRIDNGIVVNEQLETDEVGVFAAGDAARFYSPLFEKHLRVEHYDVAMKHGEIAGANMAGADEKFADLPHFFSSLFKVRTEVWGDPIQRDKIVRRGSLALSEKGGFAQFYLNQGRIQAYLSVNRPHEEQQTAEKLVLGRRTIEDVSLLSDESMDLSTLLK